MKTNWIKWIIIGVASIVILSGAVFSTLNYFKLKTEIDYAAMRKIQQEVLAEQLKKIPRDSLIIEKYYTIREVTKKQLSEFEQADSLKKDSLFWFYYLGWKAEK